MAYNESLVAAAREGRTQLVTLLLEAGAKVNHINKDRKSPLGCAVQQNYEDTAVALIKAGATLDRSSEPLMVSAAMKGQEKILRAMVASGVDVDKTYGYNKDTALIKAAWHNQINCVKALIELGASISKPCAVGYTPLSWSAWEGNAECMKILIEAGADVNHADNGAWTSLGKAVTRGRTECVKLLLAAGADVEGADSYRSHYGPSSSQTEIARLLKEARSATVLEKSTTVFSLVEQAGDKLTQEQEDQLYSLLDAGADVDQETGDGYTALSLAIQQNNNKCVELLLEFDPDLKHPKVEETLKDANRKVRELIREANDSRFDDSCVSPFYKKSTKKISCFGPMNLCDVKALIWLTRNPAEVQHLLKNHGCLLSVEERAFLVGVVKREGGDTSSSENAGGDRSCTENAGGDRSSSKNAGETSKDGDGKLPISEGSTTSKDTETQAMKTPATAGAQEVAQKESDVTIESREPDVTPELEPDVTTESREPDVTTESREPDVTTESREPDVTTESREPDVTPELEPDVTMEFSKLSVTTNITTESVEPDVTVECREPDITIESREPDVTTESMEPDVTTESREPDVTTESRESDVTTESRKPDVTTESGKPDVTAESRESDVPTESREPDVAKEPNVTIESSEPGVTTEPAKPDAIGNSEQDDSTESSASDVTSKPKADADQVKVLSIDLQPCNSEANQDACGSVNGVAALTNQVDNQGSVPEGSTSDGEKKPEEQMGNARTA